VVAVNVSGATSGVALLGRVALGVVVGVVAFVGTTVLLGAREERRTMEERAARAAARRAVEVDPGDGSVGGDPDVDDTPRARAATSSIRLITPDEGDPGAEAAGGDGPEAGTRGGPGQPSAIPFRGRLDDGPDIAPVRHLRPVPDPGGETPPAGPESDRSTVGRSAEEPGANRPPDHEE
jgi:hypothetical protein